MSSIRTIDLKFVAELVEFLRGPGYVLDFADPDFLEFFASELDVDIDDPRYSEFGGSKGKRLRRYLQLVDNESACKALKALWEYRQDFLLRAEREDICKNAEPRYLALLNRLGGSPNEGPQEAPKVAFGRERTQRLRASLLEVSKLTAAERGYAFEAFLAELFDAYGLKAREAFRNRGEQIDGSFAFGNETYLIEAKWQAAPVAVAELHAFQGKLDEKVAWARGLFISYSGFSEVGLHAFGRGKKIICMDGLDLNDCLDREIPFDHVIDRKARRAVETGNIFVRVRDLFV